MGGGGGGGGRLFAAWHLLPFSAFRMGAYSNKYGSLPVSARGGQTSVRGTPCSGL